MTDATYHDDLTIPNAFEDLWRSVLLLTIEEATTGARLFETNKVTRERMIQEARNYLTKPNKGFDEVCYLADLNPESVREHAIKMIANAPPVEVLAEGNIKQPKPKLERQRHNQHYTANGETKTLSQWAKHTGIAYSTIMSRIYSGMAFEDAIAIPARRRGQRVKRKDLPGVVSDFEGLTGTGGGSTSQDSANIISSKED